MFQAHGCNCEVSVSIELVSVRQQELPTAEVPNNLTQQTAQISTIMKATGSADRYPLVSCIRDAVVRRRMRGEVHCLDLLYPPKEHLHVWRVK